MNRLRWLPACAALLATAVAHAQVAQSPEVNYFGDDFPRSEVRRIVAAAATQSARNEFPAGLVAGVNGADQDAGKPARPLPATVKLPGGDWLFGESIALPLSVMQRIIFPGPAPPAAARVRLADGTTVNVDAFTLNEHGLSAHSASFGDLHVPLGAVAEVVYAPATHNEAPLPPKRE